MKALNYALRASGVCMALALAACGADNNPDPAVTPTPTPTPTPVPMAEFEVKLINTTANQPIAPSAIIIAGSDYKAWTFGAPASVGLETLAESGSPMALLGEAADAWAKEASGAMPFGPGGSHTKTIVAPWLEGISLTVVGMPVNTNDAFAGVTGWALGTLDVGQTWKASLPVYDAGTEKNTETKETVPGPAAGGEGFNAARDDIADAVARHPGVVTKDDGYAESALDRSHRFDQNAMTVYIKRVK